METSNIILYAFGIVVIICLLVGLVLVTKTAWEEEDMRAIVPIPIALIVLCVGVIVVFIMEIIGLC